MGMLKGHDERDMVATLEYQGKGTIQVDGQPCTLTRYRASTNYQSFSQRIQYACTRQAYSNIEVVSGVGRNNSLSGWSPAKCDTLGVLGHGQAVVTFPIPGVPGATGTATLDAKYMTERVVVTLGSTTTEFTYSNYKDWNNPLNKNEVFYAGKLVERRNNAVVRDLTTDVTETGIVPALDGKSPVGLLVALTYPDGHTVRFRNPDE
jgi:hypothetical protein